MAKTILEIAKDLKFLAKSVEAKQVSFYVDNDYISISFHNVSIKFAPMGTVSSIQEDGTKYLVWQKVDKSLKIIYNYYSVSIN